MKRTMLFAVCLILAGMLAVNGTFADDFTKFMNETISSIFAKIQGLSDPSVSTSEFDVSLVYTDSSGTPLDSTEPPMLSPGSTVERYTAVVNKSTGKNAYFRVALAVQANVFDCLVFGVNNDQHYAWSGWEPITLADGSEYMMNVATYQSALEPGKQAPAVLQTVGLKEETTNDQLRLFRSDFLQIQVLAIDTYEFSSYNSATEALNAAVPISANNHPF